MIAVDANLLVYAHRADSQWHAAAKTSIAMLWEGDAAWMIPWPCLHEFYAAVTHPRYYKPPSSSPSAITQIEEWLESTSIVLGAEGAEHWATLRSLVLVGKVVGPMVHDAKIAAICLRAGVTTLWSADRDFSRFPELHCVNPLVNR